MDTVCLPPVIPATWDSALPEETQLSLLVQYTVSSGSLFDPLAIGQRFFLKNSFMGVKLGWCYLIEARKQMCRMRIYFCKWAIITHVISLIFYPFFSSVSLFPHISCMFLCSLTFSPSYNLSPSSLSSSSCHLPSISSFSIDLHHVCLLCFFIYYISSLPLLSSFFLTFHSASVFPISRHVELVKVILVFEAGGGDAALCNCCSGWLQEDRWMDDKSGNVKAEKRHWVRETEFPVTFVCILMRTHCASVCVPHANITLCHSVHQCVLLPLVFISGPPWWSPLQITLVSMTAP